MPTGWKICARPNFGRASTREFIVNADDADAAIAAVRSLPDMQNALISVDQKGPGGEFSWLFMPVGQPRRIR
jgi:hypothetical protein